MSEYPPNKLVPSIASESLSDALATIADTSLDAAINSGALNGVPIIGIVTGLAKVARDIREAFLLRKLARFLRATAALTLKERRDFKAKFSDESAQEDFGGALLVLIDRSEDIEKPKILGRLLAAHVRGAFSQCELMRMSKMVDRSYFEDLTYLKTFHTGIQQGKEVVANSLAAAGFLYQAGIDGGDAAGNNGGIWYEITDYGQWLVEHGLD